MNSQDKANHLYALARAHSYHAEAYYGLPFWYRPLETWHDWRETRLLKRAARTEQEETI